MSFEEEFTTWLSNSLDCEIPENVAAFSFNFFELTQHKKNAKFAIELTGTGKFDPENEDWVHDKVWEPNQGSLPIPISISGSHWDMGLARVAGRIYSVLKSDSPCVSRLKSKQGIAISYLGKELEILWPQ